MRRIAQGFPAVLIGRAFSMLAREDVFDQHSAAAAHDASHFSQDLQRILHVMKRQAGYDEFELFRFERKILRISNAEGNVADTTLLCPFARDRKHGPGEGDAEVLWRSLGRR